MKSSSEGGFGSRKWMYRRGSIISVLNPRLLETEPQPGQDILVILTDEFGFTSRAAFDGGIAIRNKPQKAKTELGKRRNPFSSSPNTSPSKRTRDHTSGRDVKEGSMKSDGDVSSEITLQFKTESTS